MALAGQVLHKAPANPSALLMSAGCLRLLRSPAMLALSGRGRAARRRCGWKTLFM